MFKTIIGLEIHTQLLTKTKAFCSCSSEYFEDKPNTNICPVCTGQPGALPVLNMESVILAVRAGIALNAQINLVSYFDRKNYFYPDLTKGYQITQYFKPICENGYIEIDGEHIRIKRIHMEEDTGKMFHEGSELATSSESAIDYNRAGVPLVEIVTEPDMKTPAQARTFMEKLRDMLRYADISSGDMEKGALRCDANISVYDDETGIRSNRVEIKNINSFRYVEKALEYEQQRITETLKNGGQIAPETRGWNLSRRETFSMRSKEGEADYRYFPEPDIPPLSISEEFVQDIRRSMPELPQQKTERFIKQYSLPAYDAQVLCSSRELASYFEECAKAVKDSKFASNWIMTEVMKYINETEDYSLRSIKVGPSHYGELEELISSGKISTKIAKDVFPMMMESGKMPGLIVKEKGLEQIDNDELIVNAAKKVIQENTDAYQRYKSGKVNLLGFFVGQVMKETRGKANPEKVNQTVRELLDS